MKQGQDGPIQGSARTGERPTPEEQPSGPWNHGAGGSDRRRWQDRPGDLGEPQSAAISHWGVHGHWGATEMAPFSIFRTNGAPSNSPPPPAIAGSRLRQKHQLHCQALSIV
jgi:hypothetical protein